MKNRRMKRSRKFSLSFGMNKLYEYIAVFMISTIIFYFAVDLDWIPQKPKQRRNICGYSCKYDSGLALTVFITVCKRNTEQECIPVGCVPPARLLYLPECSARGRGACSRGVPAPVLWECLVRGGGVWYPSMHWGRTPLPPCEQNSWHTLVKILPCPKLRLRAVKIEKIREKYRNFVNTEKWEPCYS